MNENQYLYQMVYQTLKERIEKNIYKVGSKIPSEKELADEFEVSKITVKQAMSMLTEERLITRKPGLGTFVTEPKSSSTAVDAAKRATQSKVIGLVMEDISASYGLETLLTIEAAAHELGYNLVFKRSLGDQKREAQSIEQLIQADACGIIMMPTHGKSYNKEILRMVVEGFPLVMIDRMLLGIPAPFAGTNNLLATDVLMDYLFAKGHKNIAMISPPEEDATTIGERIEGYRQAFMKRGLSLRPELLLTNIHSVIPGSAKVNQETIDIENIRNFLTTNPDITAIVTTEYGITQMLLKICDELSIKIPETLSLACFDTIKKSFKNDFLTHIQQDETAIGNAAIETLDMLIKGEKPPQERHKQIFQGVFHEGDSVAKI